MSDTIPPNASQRTRRDLLATAALGTTGAVAVGLLHRYTRKQERVFIARHQTYEKDLVRTIRDGLIACEFDSGSVRGARVLLKPNLVEPNRLAPHMTTHPRMIQAAAEVFRSWGALVTVGEGPGHVRDTEQALVESGVFEALVDQQLTFADLNYQEIRAVPNRGGASKLTEFYFPRSVIEADWVVSIPKMKTHHWMGMTGALKNFYGVIPGIKYGWPKNVLHYHGIPETVFDINASLPRSIAIVDAIDCMEGDGPILGTRKSMGLVVIGKNITSVDATLCRLMGILPEKVPYLSLAGNKLGPLDERRIVQCGEAWSPLADQFLMLDLDHLRIMREAHSHFVT
jgi:uncharacterized protein (DUF362 family)